jgi:hypothetical protein
MPATKERVHAVGARVQYTRQFLKSICTGPVDDLWRLHGTVVGVHEWGDGRRWPQVIWDGETEAKMVHPNNVATGYLANID